MKSVFALYIAHGKEFLRDRLAMFFTLLLPVAFALFFGMLFGGAQSYKLGLGLAVPDDDPAAQRFAATLAPPEAQEVLAVRNGSREELLDALGKGKLDIVMVMPAGLARAVGTGKPATVEVYYDPGRQSSAGTGRGIASTLLAEANLTIGGVPRLLVAEERPVQAKPLRAADFFVPSLLGMAMLWLGLFGTAQPLVEQRVQQVLRRIGATPLSRSNLLAGQVAFRVTVGLAQAALFLLVGQFLMGVQMTGSWLLLGAAVLLGALVFVSLGYFIAAISKTAEGAVAIAQIVNFPMMFLSGTLFEANALPAYLKPVQQILPLTYLSDALRQTMVSFPPLYPLWVDFAVLGGWLVALVALSLRFFRWE